MALTYLQLTNRILPRISQSVITNVVDATGHSLIITNLINEAQNQLFTETDWYSLYKQRAFSTVVKTASTIAFVNSNPDTITDSASGLGDFQAGMEILVSGSDSNDGVYTIDTVAAGTITLQSSDTLTAESAGDSITITAITYPVASDFGRNIDLIDVTNNIILTENVSKMFDENDPDSDYTGNPLYYSIQGNHYRLYPIPAGTYTIRDRYWKIPATLDSNADTSDLPIECENLIIHWVWYKILDYLNKYDGADKIRQEYNALLRKAIQSNTKKIDKMHIFQGGYYSNNRGISPPRFPSKYGARYS